MRALLGALTIADLRLPGTVSPGDDGLHWADGAWRPGTVAQRETVPDPTGRSGERKAAPFALPGIVTVPRHVRARRVEAVIRAEVVPLLGAITEEQVAAMPVGPDPETRAATATRWLMAAYTVGRGGRQAHGSVTGTDAYRLTAVTATKGALRPNIRSPGHPDDTSPLKVPIRYLEGVPSLNITFTEDEMEAVRAAAAAEGKSLKQYVHDLSLREEQRRQFVRYATSWGEQHAAEFDDAFPDEAPPTHSERGAEAA